MTTANLNRIPNFLRRPAERTPAKLAIKAPGKAKSQARLAQPSPQSVIHGGTAPVTPDFLAAPDANPMRHQAEPAAPLAMISARISAPLARRPLLPWMARKLAPAQTTASAGEASHGDVVDLTAHRGAAAEARIDGPHPDLRAAFESDRDEPAEDEDVAFQVTLPRSVMRQIRVLAAEEGTTHRAIVLRALRAAGIEVPDGADVDRRAIAAKRRQQA